MNPVNQLVLLAFLLASYSACGYSIETVDDAYKFLYGEGWEDVRSHHLSMEYETAKLDVDGQYGSMPDNKGAIDDWIAACARERIIAYLKEGPRGPSILERVKRSFYDLFKKEEDGGGQGKSLPDDDEIEEYPAPKRTDPRTLIKKPETDIKDHRHTGKSPSSSPGDTDEPWRELTEFTAAD